MYSQNPMGNTHLISLKNMNVFSIQHFKEYSQDFAMHFLRGLS